MKDNSGCVDYLPCVSCGSGFFFHRANYRLQVLSASHQHTQSRRGGNGRVPTDIQASSGYCYRSFNARRATEIPISSEAKELIDRLVEDVVHHDVIEELAAICFFQFDLRIAQPQPNLLRTLCPTSNESILLQKAHNHIHNLFLGTLAERKLNQA